MRKECHLAYTVVMQVLHMPTLSDAIAAMNAGRRDEARMLLARILAQDRNNVTALLWMTEFATTPEEVRSYLERVLSIDPANVPAQRGLELLDKVNEEPLLVATSQPSPSQPVADHTAEDYEISPGGRTPQETMRLCPFCQKAILADSSFCRFCGRRLAATTAAKPIGDSTNNTSNVDTVTGIIIVLLIIGVLFWTVIGFFQIRVVFLGITPGYDLTGATVNESRLLAFASIFCFVFAAANLVVIRSVMQRHRRAYWWLIGLAVIGGIGALILAIIGSPGAIIGVPLCISVAYLASTIKEAFNQ
jgi:hypothetical protein